MTEYPRFTINRGLVVLLPKQPFLDWIQRVDPEPLKLSLEELRRDQDGFLVSQRKIETLEDAQRWVYRRWDALFTHFLHEWYTDQSMWPKNRTLKMFKDWFEIHYHCMIWDMAGEPIEIEDWEPDEEGDFPAELH